MTIDRKGWTLSALPWNRLLINPSTQSTGEVAGKALFAVVTFFVVCQGARKVYSHCVRSHSTETDSKMARVASAEDVAPAQTMDGVASVGDVESAQTMDGVASAEDVAPAQTMDGVASAEDVAPTQTDPDECGILVVAQQLRSLQRSGDSDASALIQNYKEVLSVFRGSKDLGMELKLALNRLCKTNYSQLEGLLNKQDSSANEKKIDAINDLRELYLDLESIQMDDLESLKTVFQRGLEVLA